MNNFEKEHRETLVKKGRKKSGEPNQFSWTLYKQLHCSLQITAIMNDHQ